MAKVISTTHPVGASTKPGWNESMAGSAQGLSKMVPNEVATGNPLSQSGVSSYAKGGEVKRPGGKAAFEKSRFDVEKPGVKEGSKEDTALDRKQMKKAGYACGGKVK